MEFLSSSIDGAKALPAGSLAMLSTGALLVVVILVKYFVWDRPPKLNLPVVGEPGTQIGRKEILEGARKVSDTPLSALPY